MTAGAAKAQRDDEPGALYQSVDPYSQPHAATIALLMNGFPLLLALCALPAVLGLALSPVVARLLAARVRPGLWTTATAGWAIVSSLVFAGWYRHALQQELDAHVAGRLREDGAFMILGFLFWNGVAILACNLAGMLVGVALRRR
jgi:hypothetical protein